MSCTSKWRWPRTRRAASRTAANASGSRSSSVSSASSRLRKTSVSSRSSASDRARMSSSNELVGATTASQRRRSFPSPKLRTLFSTTTGTPPRGWPSSGPTGLRVYNFASLPGGGACGRLGRRGCASSTGGSGLVRPGARQRRSRGIARHGLRPVPPAAPRVGRGQPWRSSCTARVVAGRRSGHGPAVAVGEQDEGGGAEQAGVGAEAGRHDPAGGGELHAGVGGEGLVQRLPEGGAGLGEAAADGGNLEVEQVRAGGEGAADRPAGAGQAGGGDLVAGGGRRGEGTAVGVVRVGRLPAFGEGAGNRARARRDRLQAAAAAAGARRAVRLHHQVADVP